MSEHLYCELYKKMLTNEPLISCFDILEDYQSDEWKHLVVFNDIKYNKILLHSNKYFDIYLICWKQNQKSPIHDHPEKGCLLKLLYGKLEEIRYINGHRLLTETLTTNEISYIESDKIVHSIEAIEDSVSLHIYCLPGYICKTY